MARKRYNLKRVEVEGDGSHRASWKFAARTFTGIEHLYRVVDQNFGRLNAWGFSIKVAKSGDFTVLQPIKVPGKRVFAGLERRAITFQKATKNPFRKKMYCKANVADPTGVKNRITMKLGDRDAFPWLRSLRSRMRLKHTVTSSGESEGYSQVILMRPEDHKQMVRTYFALRVWVLQERVVLP